jgi:hypothetical protein
MSLPITGRMVPGSAWPGACNRPARCVRFRRGNGAPLHWCNYPPRGFRSEYARRIWLVFSAVFAPLYPARGQPRNGRQSLASILPTARRIAAPWSPVPQRERCIASRMAKWRICQIAVTYTDSSVPGRERCLANSVASAPLSLPLGASGLTAIGFLASFRFGLQPPASAFTLQPRPVCPASLVSLQYHLRAAYWCFAVQAWT